MHPQHVEAFGGGGVDIQGEPDQHPAGRERSAHSGLDRVPEPAVAGCGLAVVTGLGHGSQVVPIEEQDLVAVVRYPVVDDERGPAAAGAIVLVALAKRVAGEIRQAEPLPAAAVKTRG